MIGSWSWIEGIGWVLGTGALWEVLLNRDDKKIEFFKKKKKKK